MSFVAAPTSQSSKQSKQNLPAANGLNNSSLVKTDIPRSHGCKPLRVNDRRLDGLEMSALAGCSPVANFADDIAAEIDSSYRALLKRRAPILRRQIIRVPGPIGNVQQVIRRLPTPEPDIIERVYVSVPQRDCVNLLIERPSTPQPQYQERKVVTSACRPYISQQVVSVPARQVNAYRGAALQYQQQTQVGYDYSAISPVPQYPTLQVAPQYSSCSSSYDSYAKQPQPQPQPQFQQQQNCGALNSGNQYGQQYWAYPRGSVLSSQQKQHQQLQYWPQQQQQQQQHHQQYPTQQQAYGNQVNVNNGAQASYPSF